MSEGEASFLRELFERMSASECPYAVMRNYGTLPTSTNGSDLDILIRPDATDSAIASVLRAVDASGAVVLGQAASFGFQKFFIAGRGTGDDLWGVRVDLNVGLSFRGTELLTRELKGAVSLHQGIPVLRPELASVLGVLKEVLNNSRVPTRYHAQARTAAEEGWEPIQRVLAPMGPETIERFRRLLIEASPGPCADAARRLRASLARHARHTNRGTYIRRRIGFEMSKLQRMASPSGTVIAVLGVDGVGKSTVIESVLPVLLKGTHGACEVRHLRPGLLPPLARLKGRDQVPMGPVVDPHGSHPSGPLGSTFRLVWLMTDYVLGYWVNVRPVVAKQPAIVLFDRYVYDMALDPRRFRIGLSAGLLGRLTRLAPQPDLILCLHASPYEILRRKQELPEAEIRRQLDGLEKLAASHARAVMVTTEGGRDEVRDRVLGILFEFYARRDKARRPGGYAA